ncbi:hypothetical protein [Allopusillimonas ginsengisoli]|uniref:hypothetical protein n=1 Tax=Allopusillimonas ginsengisoli TaxID=453575 RepID=UPI001022273A|nr:hypothetical protein [Allopusillimonas ginsengisoli]TEA79799.1 hypothetical protein ERE07_02335 [Allopusillimonas ginsengisoli]
MSTRTIIEINHDHLTLSTAADLVSLLGHLGLSTITGQLNQSNGNPVDWGHIRILAQRHHSESLTLKVES